MDYNLSHDRFTCHHPLITQPNSKYVLEYLKTEHYLLQIQRADRGQSRHHLLAAYLPLLISQCILDYRFLLCKVKSTYKALSLSKFPLRKIIGTSCDSSNTNCKGSLNTNMLMILYCGQLKFKVMLNNYENQVNNLYIGRKKSKLMRKNRTRPLLIETLHFSIANPAH